MGHKKEVTVKISVDLYQQLMNKKNTESPDSSLDKYLHDFFHKSLAEDSHSKNIANISDAPLSEDK